MKIEGLTFFRFIAAAIVVIFHYGRNVREWNGFLVAGPQMVTFFFVLSGFVMGYAYFNKEIDNIFYWRARAARILPVYLLALALMVLADGVDPRNYLSLLLNLFLLQSWVPTQPLTINAPGWSLSVEAFFYLTFPFLIHEIKKRNLSAGQTFAISMLVWTITQGVSSGVLSTHLYGGYPSISDDLIYYFPLSHFCSFILGVSGALWIIKNKHLIKNETASLALVGLAAVLIVVSVNNQDLISSYAKLQFAFRSSFHAPVFLLFIVAVAGCRSNLLRLLSFPPLILLGEASFSLYILQAPAYGIFSKYLAPWLNLSPSLNFSVFFVFLVGVSIACFLFFEKPANKFIRGLPPLGKLLYARVPEGKF